MVLTCAAVRRRGKAYITFSIDKKFIMFSNLFAIPISGSRSSRHSTDSGTTSDSVETRDTVFDETASPFRSSLEMSPPVSPSTPTPPFTQKGAYISKVGKFLL